MLEIRTNNTNFPLVRACIFDVDGLLINSEDIYTDIYNNILHSYGKPDLPWSIKARQQSRGREASFTPTSAFSSNIRADSRNPGHAPAPRLGPIADHV
ncbi:hypothetical protein HO173_000868 [Letharia columbiana]|uniref:2-deoxyglucose-6-phosphate phosphatase n=1 Tax=Letharia columbiana TaxID=112416 RepID=A0A8H6G5Q6_9LECA|nr:uncharacterized protein HO173_000868 [Letharia columbiana]KAF6241074.1 hypothetical protein HO173_000868 [Letharia columbiana]